MRNFQIGVDKVVEKALINLLGQAKSAACIISIIINAPDILLKLLYSSPPPSPPSPSALHTC